MKERIIFDVTSRKKKRIPGGILDELELTASERVAFELVRVAKILVAFDAEEEAQRVYDESLDDAYWKEVSGADPNIVESVEYVVHFMGAKYADRYLPEQWYLISNILRNKVFAGLT